MSTVREAEFEPQVESRDELTAALWEAIDAGDGARLIQARVASGMWME